MTSAPKPPDEPETGGTDYLIPDDGAPPTAGPAATQPATDREGPAPESSASSVQDTTVSGSAGKTPQGGTDDAVWGSGGGSLPHFIQPGDLIFERFRVERKLGQGGMGDVWLVRHVELEALHALKMIVANIAGDTQIRQRFRREARLMAGLKHRNAVIVHDARMSGDAVFIDMEYVQGRSINTLQKAGEPMPLPWVENVLTQLCDVLQAAHDQGIVHRDLKPTNLMLVDGGQPGKEELKVLDFGIAKLITPEGTHDDFKTNPGQFIGTPQYSSPEQIDSGLTDHRSDLYSVGVMLYEFLTGSRPFTGARVLMDHLVSTPPPFQVRNPTVTLPLAVEQVVLRCLAKDPAERPQSARELLTAFRTAVHTGLTDPEAASSPESTGLLVAAGSGTGGSGEATGVLRPLAATGTMLPATGPQAGGSSALVDTEQATGTMRIVAAVARPLPLTILGLLGVIAAVAAAVVLIPRPAPPGPDYAGALKVVRGMDAFEPAEGTGGDALPLRIVRKDAADPARATRYSLRSFALEDGSPVYISEHFDPEVAPVAGQPEALVQIDGPAGDDQRVRLVFIPGGTYLRGGFDARPDATDDPYADRPAHPATVSDFYFQDGEVTNGQFLDYLRAEGSGEQGGPENWRRHWLEAEKELGRDRAALLPAVGVPFTQAETFARRLGGRLPTEAEWEFAARSRGLRRRYVPGDVAPDGASVNLDTVGPRIGVERGKIRPTDRTIQGIFDLTGNVREMCRDLWQLYPDDWARPGQGPPVDWDGPPRHGPNLNFAVRGGSYKTAPLEGMTTYRRSKIAENGASDEAMEDIGFRIVVEPIPRIVAVPTAELP